MKGKTGRDLNEKEKTLIAMAAAMGAGCTKYAEQLFLNSSSLKISIGEIRRAFEMGLNAKAQTVNTMRAAVSYLLQKEAERDVCGAPRADEVASAPEIPGRVKLESLIRIAAYAASNSADDALSEMDEAISDGAGSREIYFSLATAGRVREKAARFCEEDCMDYVRETKPILTHTER